MYSLGVTCSPLDWQIMLVDCWGYILSPRRGGANLTLKAPKVSLVHYLLIGLRPTALLGYCCSRLSAEWGDIRSNNCRGIYELSIEMDHLSLSRKVSHKILKWVEKQIPTKLESELKKFQVSWVSKSQVTPRSRKQQEATKPMLVC